jgi:hypothetical protein
VKRLRWSAVLVGLVLMLSWAGAAQAQTTTDQTAGGPTEGQVVTPPPDTPPAQESQERVCSPAEGLTTGVDQIEIKTDTAGAHPTASASFTVKEGCLVRIVLESVDENKSEVVDSDPPLPESGQIPTSGPGDHTLTVDLPSCSKFFVALDAVMPGQEPPLRAQRGAAVLDTRRPRDEDVILGQATGTTKNCPTLAGAPPSDQPTTTTTETADATETAPADELPFTGSKAMPLLIAGLVLVTGGGAMLFGARVRGRHTSR